MIAALWALFLRPVGFKYRSMIHNDKWRNAWDWILFTASIIPAIIFGVAIGNLFLGIPFSFDAHLVSTYTGSFFGLLSPFALLCGLVSASMLIMQGGTYLAHRTEGIIQARAIKFTLISAIIFVALFALGGIIVSRLNGFVIDSTINPAAMINPSDKMVSVQVGAWLFNFYKQPLLWLFPIIGGVCAILVVVLLKTKRTLLAFIFSSLSILGVIMTAGVALFPFLLPSSSHPNMSLTTYDSVSSHLTLMVMLYVTVFLLPIIVSYTAWAYKVMSGKVTDAYIKENQKTLY